MALFVGLTNGLFYIVLAVKLRISLLIPAVLLAADLLLFTVLLLVGDCKYFVFFFSKNLLFINNKTGPRSISAEALSY